MTETVLTIAIPTYNRAAYLDRCLGNIVSQLGERKDLVELIVSDNASADHTRDIVQKYINAGYSIKYIKNAENKGADFNVAQCYLSATGKYMIAFGDDDVFVTGAIETIINFLQTTNVGLVYIAHYALPEFNFIDKKVEPVKVRVNVINNKKKFIKRVSYYTTFLSGNIINRKALHGIDIRMSQGSNLGHVPLILKAFKQFETNAIIETPLIGMQVGNTGGYGLFMTFATNYMTLINKSFITQEEKSFKKIIINDMLQNFFPFWICQLKKKSNFQGENIYKIMYPLFRRYVSFWICDYPLIKMNGFFSNIYLKGISVWLSIINKFKVK